MRRGHDDFLALRQNLMHIERHIPRTREDNPEHVVNVAPLDFLEKVAEHSAQHRAAPDDRGSLSSTKKPMDMTFTPKRSMGWIRPSTISGRSSMPIISGTLKP